MKSECQAYSVKTRVRMRNAGSAPPWRSWANSALPLAWPMKSAMQGVEMLDRHRVVVFPPDDRGGLGVAHNELVLGAASGVHAGVGDKRSMRRDVGFVALQRLLVELRRAEVPMNGGKVAKAELIRAEVDVARPILDHPERPSSSALEP